VYGDGKQTRSFCYVDDMVEGLYRLLLSEEMRPVNLGNPNELTIGHLAELINRLTENDAGVTVLADRRGAADPQRRKPDIARANESLGWQPTVDLEMGLRRTIEDFRIRM
jgi:dTDP-glucose 4,6-dehydratase